MATTIAEPAEVTVFLERILDDGGKKDVEPEVRQQMLDDLRQRFQNKLFATIVMKIPEQDLPALNDLIQRKAPESQVQDFVRAKLPNLDGVLAEAMTEFRKLYVKPS